MPNGQNHIDSIGTNYDPPTFWPILSPPGGENPKIQPKMACFWPFWPVFSVQSLQNPVQTSSSGPGCPKRSEIFATESVQTARNFLSLAPLDGIASTGLHAHFSARKWAFWPPSDQPASGALAAQTGTFQPGRISETRPLRAEPTCSTHI